MIWKCAIIVMVCVFVWKYQKKQKENVEKCASYAKKGDKAFEKKWFQTALMNYGKALRKIESVDLYYRIIVCLIVLRRKDEARIILQKGFKYCRAVKEVTKIDESEKLVELKRKYNL